MQDLVIPVAIDNTQPEYVIKAETYAERMRVRWQPGDRFRMFFGGQVSRKTHKRVKTGASTGRSCRTPGFGFVGHSRRSCLLFAMRTKPGIWANQRRFMMQYMKGASLAHGAGGVWYKGTVVDLKQAQPGKEAPLEEKERYDPWESLLVHWDRGG